MRKLSIAFLCGSMALAQAGCAHQEAMATPAETAQTGETYFEVTPGVAVASGVTAVVALGVLAIVACGIACAQ